MKFTCLQENLAKGLQTVTRAISVKSPLPILSNVLIQIEDGKIKLAATNLETTIVTYIGGSIQEEGKITIPAKLLKEFITNLPAGSVDIETDQDIMHVSSKKTKSRFNGTNAEEYPDLPIFPEDAAYLELDPKLLEQTIASVAFSAGTEDNRSATFSGILLDYKESLLTVACTDGFRLSEKTLKVDSKLENFSVVVQAKTLAEVVKVFAAHASPVKIAITEGQSKVLFKSEDTFISTSVIGDQYPDYKRIIPTEFILNAIFDAQEFFDAVKLTNIVAKEANSIVRVRFDPEGLIKLSSLAQETGEHESQVEASIEGDLMEIAVNAKYLMDYLTNIKTQKIKFNSKGNMSPCVFVTDEHEDYIHIIMPMQI